MFQHQNCSLFIFALDFLLRLFFAACVNILICIKQETVSNFNKNLQRQRQRGTCKESFLRVCVTELSSSQYKYYIIYMKVAACWHTCEFAAHNKMDKYKSKNGREEAVKKVNSCLDASFLFVLVLCFVIY